MSERIRWASAQPLTDIDQTFTQPLLQWFNQHGRRNLPWQTPRTPYRVWISEIMLQQTQVKTVIPYFNRFIARFPDISTLSHASEDDVLAYWSGLGYYSRGRAILQTAKKIMNEHGAQLPATVDELQQLPGIGPSTAAAIVSLAFNQPAAILDGNVKRVLSRYFLVDGPPSRQATKKQLATLATAAASTTHPADYTQAIMDLGATLCTSKNPACFRCPLQSNCLAYQQNVVEQYPEKATKKTLPIKHEQFLLLHTPDHQLYLEKRASKGLWGGLWCLPSIALDKDPIEFIQQQHQHSTIRCLASEPLLRIKHTFSHFQLILDAMAIAIIIDEPHPSLGTSQHWFHQQDLDSIGLAKPIQDIIQHFFQTRHRPTGTLP